MAKFTFSVNTSNINDKKVVNKIEPKKEVRSNGHVTRVELTKHDAVKYEPGYYSYINSDNQKCKYSGIVITDADGSYIGKTITTHKVVLEYHPKVESAEAREEYFSYIDNNGIERVFKGSPEFNLETNSYFGRVNEEILHDEMIQIFKEEK